MRPSRIGCSIWRNVQRSQPLRSQLRPGPRLISPRWITASPWARAKSTNDDEDITVRWFEDRIHGESRKRRRLSPEEMQENDEVADENPEDIFQADHFGDALAMMDELNEEDNEELRALHDGVFSEDELQGMRDAEPPARDEMFPHEVVIQSVIPRQSKLFLNNFNQALEMVMAHPLDDARKKELWRWYTRCKTQVPDFLRSIPSAAWDFLWQSQGEDVASNPERLSKLRQIAEDKQFAGWTLSLEERSKQIEALFLSGKRSTALEQYEHLLSSASEDDSELREMGIRMYGHDGQAERCLELLERAFSQNPATNPRLMINVIKSFISQKTEQSSLKAYDLYRDMSQRLSSDMTMQDYDVVSMEFLAAGETEFALAVFRDMMIQGELSQKGRAYFSGSKAAGSLAQFVASSPGKDATKLSREAIKQLPRRFQNKFFYASWLKKLLGEGEVESALRVVDLMYKRGANPDAKHVNGIVASLIRMPEAQAKQRAESIAWAMIQSRLNHTAARRGGLVLDDGAKSGLIAKDSSAGLNLPQKTTRPVPMATIETFSILLQYYARRSRFEYVRRLRDLLVDAEIPMNSFFMNHILYAELHSRGYGYAFARFDVLSRQVRPDLETHLCLWQAMKNLIHDKRNNLQGDFSGYPTHRQLFAQMLKWLSELSSKERNAAMTDMTPEVYHTILRAFATAHDLKGMFVALYALPHHFNIRPDQDTAQIIQQMVGAIEPASPKKLPAARHRHMRRAKVARKSGPRQDRDMQNAGIILDAVRNSRVERYLEDQVNLDDISPEDTVEESYRACLEIVWTVLRRSEGDADGQTQRVVAAARDMGVDGLEPEAAMQLLDL